MDADLDLLLTTVFVTADDLLPQRQNNAARCNKSMTVGFGTRRTLQTAPTADDPSLCLSSEHDMLLVLGVAPVAHEAVGRDRRGPLACRSSGPRRVRGAWPIG